MLEVDPRPQFEQVKTLKFVFPIVPSPHVELNDELEDKFDWGDRYFLIEKGAREKSAVESRVFYPVHEIRDFGLFSRMVELYDDLLEASPRYFKSEKDPSIEEIRKIVNIVQEWIAKNGFPIFLHNQAYTRSEDLIGSTNPNAVLVRQKANSPRYRVNMTTLFTQLFIVIQASGIPIGSIIRPDLPVDLTNNPSSYLGDTIMKFSHKGVYYFSEDMFTAVHAQLKLYRPEARACKNPICNRWFVKKHNRQVYCGLPGCDPHTVYNHSEKGLARSRKNSQK